MSFLLVGFLKKKERGGEGRGGGGLRKKHVQPYLPTYLLYLHMFSNSISIPEPYLSVLPTLLYL